MSKREYNEMREEVAAAPKKKRKHNLFSLILCLLVAFIIWLYASSLEKKNEEELHTNTMECPRVSEAVLLTSEL